MKHSIPVIFLCLYLSLATTACEEYMKAAEEEYQAERAYRIKKYGFEQNGDQQNDDYRINLQNSEDRAVYHGKQQPSKSGKLFVEETIPEKEPDLSAGEKQKDIVPFKPEPKEATEESETSRRKSYWKRIWMGEKPPPK